MASIIKFTKRLGSLVAGLSLVGLGCVNTAGMVIFGTVNIASKAAGKKEWDKATGHYFTSASNAAWKNSASATRYLSYAFTGVWYDPKADKGHGGPAPATTT